MYDEDQDALAAEYVLGTLSVEERGRAEALLLIDTAFVELVRQWERRLGELNVMVESVEPPADLISLTTPSASQCARQWQSYACELARQSSALATPGNCAAGSSRSSRLSLWASFSRFCSMRMVSGVARRLPYFSQR